MGRILFFVALAVAMWVAWTLSRRRNSLDNEERRELKRLRAKERGSGKVSRAFRRGDGQVRPLRPLLSQTRGRAQQGARLLLEALPRCGAGRAMTSPDRAFDGWLPGVVRRLSPHFNERPEGALVSLAVLHFISLPAGRFGGEDVDALFMGTLDAMNRPEYESLRGLRVSSHFFVRRTGEVRQYVSVLDRAWHAGVSSFEGHTGCNDFSVGIELEGTGETPYEDAQYLALGELLGTLTRVLPVEAVTGHEHIAPGRKQDPGPSFDWDRVREMVPGRVRIVTEPQVMP